MLEHFFKPRSIAIIGASRRPEKIGHTILSNLKRSGFRGRLYPVNPHATAILGMRCYKNVREVGVFIDLAVIAVPAEFVAQALTECGKSRIRSAIVISSGFAEIGEVGAKRDTEIRRICARYRISLLGPNCLGVIHTGARANISFASEYPTEGGISFVSQSGAILVSLIDWSKETRTGMRSLISLGNQSGITQAEVIAYLAKDPKTKVIGVYVEEIRNPYEFMRAIAAASRRKPVVVLAAGSSSAGQRAVSSHTGSLAGSTAVISHMLAAAGAIQVRQLEELFNVLRLLAVGPISKGEVLVITNAGGPGVLVADEIERSRARLVVVPDRDQRALRTKLPEGASVANPIDLMGDADLKRYGRALRWAIQRGSHDVVYVLATPQRMTPLERLARTLVSLQRHTSKRIIASFIGGSAVNKSRQILAKGGIVHFAYPNDAIQALAAALRVPGEPHTMKRIKHMQHTEGVRMQLPYRTVQRMLVQAGIPIERGRIIANEKGLLSLSRFPIVMKVLSRDIIHKAAAGGVSIGIASRKEAVAEFRRLRRLFKQEYLEGMLVQPMVLKGSEWIIGAKRDPLVGGVVLVGAGGTHAEELHDLSMAIAPLTRTEADRMVSRVRQSLTLTLQERKHLISLLLKISALLYRHPQIEEIDLNPVKIHSKGGIVVDARIIGLARRHSAR